MSSDRELDQEIKDICNQARKSIENFCMHECHAYCCRKGYLVLSDAELKLIVGDEKDKLLSDNSLTKTKKGRWSLNLGKHNCPRLDDETHSRCTIHDDPGRPDTCRQFPLFIKDNQIIISARCPAARQRKLYPYIRRLRAKGLEFAQKDVPCIF